MELDYVASKKIGDKPVTLGAYKMGKYGRELAISPAGWEFIANCLKNPNAWANIGIKTFPSNNFPDNSAKKDAMQDGNTYEAAKSGYVDDSDFIPF